MAPATFHPFPRLPTELRDEIWNFAIRSDEPGAHFFTLFSNDAEWSNLAEFAASPDKSVDYTLAAPRCSGGRNPGRDADDHAATPPPLPSWTDANPSAYLIDSGLWTACRESRAAMERVFHASAFASGVVPHLSGPATTRQRRTRTSAEAPATGAFATRDDGQVRCFATYPRTDLFVVQPADVARMDWAALSATLPLPHYLWGAGVTNLALEYDAARWRFDAEEDPYDSKVYDRQDDELGAIARAAAGDLDCAETLWFVDYRLRRRTPEEVEAAVAAQEEQAAAARGEAAAAEGEEDAEKAEDDNEEEETPRATFAGSDCRFVEVHADDVEWETELGSDGAATTVFRFLADLHRAVDKYFEDKYSSGADTTGTTDGTGSVPHYESPEIRVLAYERIAI